MISRADTAAVVVAALDSEKTKNTVVEVVWSKEERPDRATPDALFAYLKPNDGAHDPTFYSEAGVEATSTQT